MQHNKVDYATELLNEVAEKVKKRNKLIRIADSSVGGWDTVKLYESNPIASDSEDESRINKAENRAIKRKRSIPKIKRISSAGGRSTDAPMHSMDRPIGAPPRSTFPGSSTTEGVIFVAPMVQTRQPLLATMVEFQEPATHVGNLVTSAETVTMCEQQQGTSQSPENKQLFKDEYLFDNSRFYS